MEPAQFIRTKTQYAWCPSLIPRITGSGVGAGNVDVLRNTARNDHKHCITPFPHGTPRGSLKQSSGDTPRVQKLWLADMGRPSGCLPEPDPTMCREYRLDYVVFIYAIPLSPR